jgi:uncharacterized protein (DUF488 family)
MQIANRDAWNDSLSIDAADFYTVGYSGRTMTEFIKALKSGGIVTLIDIRHTPVSMYKPEFSKRNLERHLARHSIEYLHLPALGVPRDIRARAVNQSTRDLIWQWYDEHVVPTVASRNLHWFFNSADHPVAFMCTEIDPTACHRHRLALALGEHGLKFFDL